MIPNIADTVPKVWSTGRSFLIIFQAFKIPDDTHNTHNSCKKPTIFSEGVESSYKYEERQWH